MREMFKGNIGFFRVVFVVSITLIVIGWFGELMTKVETQGSTTMQFAGFVLIFVWIIAEIIRSAFRYYDYS